MRQLSSREKPARVEHAAGKSELAFAARENPDGVREQVAPRACATVGRSEAERWKIDGEAASARVGRFGHVGLGPGRRPLEAAAYARRVRQAVANLDRQRSGRAAINE